MKHMKKSMFITTLAMVVVLVVALSTATFAWYTANTTVTATPTAAQSATSDAAAIAVETSAITAQSTGTSVTMTLTGTIGPMIVTTDLSAAGNVNSTPVFTTAPVSNANTFTSNGTPASAATIATVQDNNDANATNQAFFYVGNTNKDTTPSVKATVTIAGGYIGTTVADAADFANKKSSLYTANAAKTVFTVCTDASYDENADYYVANANIATYLRVALYASDTDGTNTSYIGTWALTNTDVAYGSIVSGESGLSASNSNISTYSAIASGSSTGSNAFSLTGVDSKRISAYVWFDGCLLTATESQAYCTFAISFDKVNN